MPDMPKFKKDFQKDFEARGIYGKDDDGKDVPLDTTSGWQPGKKALAAFVRAEHPKATTAWTAMPSPAATSIEEWVWLMWMWARRTRRDILVLEAYLKAEYTVGNLTGEPPFYDDPGDPPPPPDGFI